MEKLLPLLGAIAFAALLWWINNFLQRLIRPREAGWRLLLYFVSVLLLILLASVAVSWVALKIIVPAKA